MEIGQSTAILFVLIASVLLVVLFFFIKVAFYVLVGPCVCAFVLLVVLFFFNQSGVLRTCEVLRVSVVAFSDSVAALLKLLLCLAVHPFDAIAQHQAPSASAGIPPSLYFWKSHAVACHL